MTASPQTELSLRSATFKLPLTNRGGALGLLAVPDWQLESLIDAGAIRGVLNIASTASVRAELRFLVVAVEEFKRELRIERTNAELAEIIFGRPQPLVRAHWIRTRLLCHETHFTIWRRSG